MKYLTLCTLAFLIVVVASCTKRKSPASPFLHIKDEQVKNVLEKAIARSGGWGNYKSIDSVFYKKRTVLLDSLGNVESDEVQFHKYQLNPYLGMSISWEKNREKHEIVYKENNAKKLVNNQLVEADSAALVRTCMSAYYVLFMPFKLLDAGVLLSYKGIAQLPNGKEVHVIAADYDQDENKNHSTKDNWEYYFDKNTCDFVANMVDHGDYFALVYNEEYIVEDGLRFNAFRPSFRVNADRSHLWKRGEFFYSDFKLK